MDVGLVQESGGGSGGAGSADATNPY